VNVTDYLAKSYPTPPCWALVADVYTSELGQAVDGYQTINSSVRAIAAAFRLALHKSPHGFGQIAQPVDYAVVLMGRTPTLGLHHCGVYYEGRVLHALADGTLYQDMASLAAEYPLMEFWSKGS
jgi:hypothetical protein